MNRTDPPICPACGALPRDGPEGIDGYVRQPVQVTMAGFVQHRRGRDTAGRPGSIDEPHIVFTCPRCSYSESPAGKPRREDLRPDLGDLPSDGAEELRPPGPPKKMRDDNLLDEWGDPRD